MSIDCRSPVTRMMPNDGCNLHSFYALSDVWFLDLLGPPYKDDCTYFRQIRPEHQENDVQAIYQKPHTSVVTLLRDEDPSFRSFRVFSLS